MMNNVRIGITIGDPSGIGPEVIIKALRRFNRPRDCQVTVIGDKAALTKSGLSKKDLTFNLLDTKSLRASDLRFGLLSKKFGEVSLGYLKQAVTLLKSNDINCLVTGPVNKRAISLVEPSFCGHTEFLVKNFGVNDHIMLFCSGDIRVSLVTRHIPLRHVAASLSIKSLLKTLFLSYEFCKKYLGIRCPRIGVAGLNPHASDNGLFGGEEASIIEPAIHNFIKRKLPVVVSGPIPPDIIFTKSKMKMFDIIVCMYHDQGLIPFKMLHFFDGVNVTMGLPFVRTSCDHGTAFEIAGKNKADCRSLLSALRLSYKLTKNKLRT